MTGRQLIHPSGNPWRHRTAGPSGRPATATWKVMPLAWTWRCSTLVVMTAPSRAGSRRSLGRLAARVPFEDPHRVLGADGPVEPRVGELQLVCVAVDQLAVDGRHRAREHDHAVERATDASTEAGEQ